MLWVFSLLTSGNNPASSTRRPGARASSRSRRPRAATSPGRSTCTIPTTRPTRSTACRSRPGRSTTSSAAPPSPARPAGPDVEPGLESKAANCERYTGSALLVTRSGLPGPLRAAGHHRSGQAALVSDVFQQWMGGTPAAMAAQAGVLFENAGNPGNPQVQAILTSLPSLRQVTAA